MHYEVEQKFRAPDLNELERRLAARAVTLGPPQTQVDTYFAHPARDFAKTDEALRIRRVGQQTFITYKGAKVDATTKTRQEIEASLSDGAAAAKTMGDIFVALGFRAVAEVRKQRRAAKIPWQGREVEIALDEVDGVGTFVELELSADGTDLDAARAALASLAADLGLTANERSSYLEMLLAQRK